MYRNTTSQSEGDRAVHPLHLLRSETRQSLLSLSFPPFPMQSTPRAVVFVSDHVSKATPLSITRTPPSSRSEASCLVCADTRVSHTVCISQSSLKRGDAFRIKVTQILSVCYLQMSMIFCCTWNKNSHPLHSPQRGCLARLPALQLLTSLHLLSRCPDSPGLGSSDVP